MAAVLRIGDLEIDMRLREARRGTSVVRLQHQPFEILALLLARAGQVVTRAEIRARLWPDGTSVDFEHSVNAAVKRLRAALGDDATNPRLIETMPRRGYRFIGRPDPASRRDDRAADGRARPRLAVSPFVIFGEAAADAAFRDGLAEELVAQLARRSADRIGVLARAAPAATRPGEHTDAAPVDFLVVGSVRVIGDRVRIVARLVDRRDGTHRWAHVYDGAAADTLRVQTDVAAAIAESVVGQLVPPGADARAGQLGTPATRRDAGAPLAFGLRRWSDVPLRSLAGA